MTPPDGKKDSFAFKTFKRRKVIVIKELSELLASSLMTARRRLKQWHTHTSYSHNGRYYVLHDVAKFDKHGLWQYKDIFFSKYGNLRKTVIHLVKTSASGLAAAEIGELVGLRPWSFLSHFHNEPQLKREKVEGRFVYEGTRPERADLLQRVERDGAGNRERVDSLAGRRGVDFVPQPLHFCLRDDRRRIDGVDRLSCFLDRLT